METLKVPYIKGLSEMDDRGVLLSLEESGARFIVGHNNWPDLYPYTPLCGGEIALSDGVLAVHFHVRGLDLRAMNTEDNMRQWEDSCCELFIEDPDGGKYYNFEMNCCGKILSASGDGRKDRVKRPLSEMQRIRRISWKPEPPASLPFNLEGDIYTWDVAALIPLDLIGIDGNDLPESLRANFYKCGDLTAHPHYLSWSPIGTPKPDFHRPEFFGTLILIQK